MQLFPVLSCVHFRVKTCNALLVILFYYLFFIIILGGVKLSPLGTAATDGDRGAIAGMKIGRGNPNTRRKPVPAPLCPPQIPHSQTQARTRADAMGSRRLTA
jgi:hypothetical protein